MIEKRRFLRFLTTLTVDYRICKDKEIEGTSLIKNVSRGGIRFLIPIYLERGTMVALKLLLPGQDEPIFLTGEVAWAKKGLDEISDEYTTGIKFSRISNLDTIRIIDFAYTRWLQSSSGASNRRRWI